MLRKVSLLVIAIHFLSGFLHASVFGIKPDGRLDQAAVHQAYQESEWDKTKDVLEKYLKRNGEKALPREEKIFAYKHLGVIYGADTLTRVRAESYFTLLLELAPDIEIVDMYASKKVRDLFQETKQDFLIQALYLRRHDAYGNPLPPEKTADTLQTRKGKAAHPVSGKPAIRDQGHGWLWWTLGAAAIGAGVGIYVWTQTGEDKEKVRTLTPGSGN